MLVSLDLSQSPRRCYDQRLSVIRESIGTVGFIERELTHGCAMRINLSDRQTESKEPSLGNRRGTRAASRQFPPPAYRLAASISKLLSKSSLLVLCLAVLIFPGVSLHGRPQPQIKITVKVVNVLATVRDKRGQIVSTLSRNDFVLEDNGRPQGITYFATEEDLPLSLGLLVDTSGSQVQVLGQERMASQKFLDDMLRENDQAFLARFDGAVVIYGLSSSREKLAGDFQSLLGPRASGTVLYDAAVSVCNRVTSKLDGRKAIIFLTDGVDNGSQHSLPDAIMAAQRADTVVYSILFADEQFYPDVQGPSIPSPAGRRSPVNTVPLPQSLPSQELSQGRDTLERISKETGGRMFVVSRKEPIDQIFSTIEEELRNQYALGYALGADAGSGYRKIRLATKQKGMIVQTRAGYYAD
jgi:VWFA-related protein